MKYKTAKELQLTEGEHKWLIKTMNVLKNMRPATKQKIDGLKVKFDMSYEFKIRTEDNLYPQGDEDPAKCNTSGCIRGWMGLLATAANEGKDLGIRNLNAKNLGTKVVGGEHKVGYWGYSDPLECLFYPDLDNYDKVTPVIAAKAIKCLLMGKPIDWGKATDKNY